MSIKLSFSEDGNDAEIVTNEKNAPTCLHNKTCDFLVKKETETGSNMHCKVSSKDVFWHYYNDGKCPQDLWWKVTKKDDKWHEEFKNAVCKYDISSRYKECSEESDSD